MSNNGWIKYSEEKPKSHGHYLVVNYGHIVILHYITQEDICEYNQLQEQIDKLDQEWNNEINEIKAAAIREELLALYDKQNSCYVGELPCGHSDFDEEGFYDWIESYDGDGDWAKQDVIYWHPLPELPTE